MISRRFSYLVSTLIAAAVLLLASPAEAGKQATLANPPASMRPGQTSSVHEIGVSLNGNFNPDAFIPAFNWRFHLPKTGRVGQLSGLFMGFNAGPAVNFYGVGRGSYGGGVYGRGDRDFYREVWGRAGFELGYEIDPWSNLALTFAPVMHNDFHFSPYFFQFEQTFGPAVRLYINQHWVFYFEPGFVGWNVWTDIDRNRADNDNFYYSGVGLSVRGGVGFAYKF
ncbi:hypothetical protein ENSA5_62280 [Enhygromyxa salina]|uniref:Outer membrane protein beta-barrel domain-containing protein n=1 Tax=Enhygromyxa salina TaxID=215803 RepID=A0A2S9XCX3_9BACT|nr:hypothetical protein [Enhygromyxa salina]PRP90714.1 hypothetical protein ENSA5_62280 [Enhygromyxa salina]